MMVRRVGRYQVYGEFAVGGMASVHLGRLVGATGFSRTVAIKILHPQFAKVSEVSAMLVDEAHLAGRVRHVNVVSMLDIVNQDGELFLVMDYVHGASLAAVLTAERERGQSTPCAVACAVARDVLRGLHAAHEATNEHGEPLAIVHRDVSPQNVVVGVDGVARVLDFGIAKAAMRAQSTDGTTLKGKLSYMAPEQLLAGPVDPRADVFSASLVLWEMLAGARRFHGDEIVGQRMATFDRPAPSLKSLREDVPAALDEIVARGLASDPAQRFPSAAAMADAIEEVIRPSRTAEVRAWMEALASSTLAERARLLAEMETGAGDVVSARTHAANTKVDRGDEATVTTYAGATSPTSEELRSRSSWRPKLVGVSVAVAIVVAALALLMPQRRTAIARPTSTTEPSAADGPQRLVAPALREDPPPTSAPSSALSASSSPPNVRAAARAFDAPRAPEGARAPRPALPKRPKSKVRPDCDPPFEYHAGVKQFKSECI